MYSICKIKNISGEVLDIRKAWSVDEEYTVPDSLRIAYASDSSVITAITNEQLQVGSDTEYFEDTAYQVRYLTSSIPQDITGEVTTQYEKNDKTLRTICAFATTDSNGVARVCFKIPSNGRKIAFGDAEFETRHIGDRVSKIEVTDLERQIAWMIALMMDPEAEAPVSDEVIQNMGDIEGIGELPYYPTLDYYDERSMPSSNDAPYNEGTILGGVGMTFQFGSTEISPIGGYGNLPGNMYMVLECTKATGHQESGIICQFSIDWAEPHD